MVLSRIDSLRMYISDEYDWECLRGYARDLCHDLRILSDLHGEKLHIYGRDSFPITDIESCDNFLIDDFVIEDNELGSDVGVIIRLLTRLFDL